MRRRRIAGLSGQTRFALRDTRSAELSPNVGGADAVSAKAARARALAELERVFGGPPSAEALAQARRALRGESTPRSA